MLFLEPPTTHEHIRQFCAKFNEGIRVEYKGPFDQSVRSKLPKILSSFANSHGGVLVIGVDTVNGVPQPPFDGFPEIPREELPLTVENICLQNLDPPIFPKSTVIRSDAAGKIFLIIEVEESGEAPHAIENSTQVYVRTGAAANPYELATVALIIDLVQRRKEPLERANRLLSHARERAGHIVVENATYVEVSVCPTYPRVPLCSSQEVWDFTDTHDAQREGFMPHNWKRRIPDGVASIGGGGQARHQSREVNKYGLLLGRSEFEKLPYGREANAPMTLSFGTLFQLLSRTLVCARRLYSTHGYSGSLLVHTTLQNVRSEFMVFLPVGGFPPNLDDYRCVTTAVSSTQVTSAEEIKDRWREVLYRVMAEVCWSFWQSFDEFPSDGLRRSLEASAARLP